MSFEEILQKELNKPVALKNQPGVYMEPMEAMVKSLMNNAMKGDIASIAFIQNMTKTHDAEAEQKQREEHEQRLNKKCEELKSMLVGEGNYFNQDEEVKQLAEISLLIDKLSYIIAAPDFQEVMTDARTGKMQISPVITLRDQQKDRFDKLLNNIRVDALKRKMEM